MFCSLHASLNVGYVNATAWYFQFLAWTQYVGAALFNQDKILRLAFHTTHMKALQSSKYTCNLIISRLNCRLSTVVFHSHIHQPRTPNTIWPDISFYYIHVCHKSFASAWFGQSAEILRFSFTFVTPEPASLGIRRRRRRMNAALEIHTHANFCARSGAHA